MSLYQVQKLCRDVNRDPACRERYLGDHAAFADGYGLSAEERLAVVELDIGALYAMGVHALLLRPFTIINGVSEPDYLAALG